MSRPESRRRVGRAAPLLVPAATDGRGRFHRGYAVRSRAASINRDISAPGEFTDPARIALGLRQRQISGDGDDAKDLQFPWRRQRQQDRDRIVDAGIGIDNYPAPHYLSTRSSAIPLPPQH